MNQNQHDTAIKLTPEAFAILGGGEIAYVKSVRSEDVRACFHKCRNSPRASNCSRCTRRTAPRSC
jgi:hypothetical protein